MKYIILVLLMLPALALAEEEYRLVIEQHRFQPREITIPAGKKIRLHIENHDNTPEEFDSHALNREKVVTGNSSGLVFIGPLEPGRYPFMGEFHADTAQGTVIAQ